MGPSTLLERIREWIGGLGWRLYIHCVWGGSEERFRNSVVCDLATVGENAIWRSGPDPRSWYVAMWNAPPLGPYYTRDEAERAGRALLGDRCKTQVEKAREQWQQVPPGPPDPPRGKCVCGHDRSQHLRSPFGSHCEEPLCACFHYTTGVAG